MKLKNILLLPALAIACMGCNNDATDGEISLTGAANEIQLEIGGKGESVDYTKAIASDSENKIENLDVYIFASDADGSTYKYLDKWESAATNDKIQKKFFLQASGSKWNASIFPTEVAGYPFLKFFLVANREDNLYKENGATELTLTPFTNGTDFAVATDEAAFLQSYTKAITTTQILHPSLLMTGNGKTKMLGTVSNVKIELQRVVSRFDIDNTSRLSNLTIESIALQQGRKTGSLWSSGTLTTVAEGDLGTSPLLTEYKEIDYTAFANANNGVTESAIYVYPTLATDKASLIIKGKYRDPANGSEKAATYTVPLQKTDGGTGIAADIAVLRNNRYKLQIINVTNTTMAAAFEIEDWTSSGGITIKPEAPMPMPATFTATGAAEVEGDKIRIDVDGGTFTLEAFHPNKPVSIETTPTYETTYGSDSWLTVDPITKAAGNAEATQVTVAANNSTEPLQRTHEVHIGYITVKWGETPEEQMILAVYRGASFVTYLDTEAGQTVRFAAIKMKDDRYWAPINVGATIMTNKAVTTANTDITAACGKLFQWGRLYGFTATNNESVTAVDTTGIGSGAKLGRPVQSDLANMSKWDGKFIPGTSTLQYNWLQINGEGNANPGDDDMQEGAWYQQLWNANAGINNTDVVKTAADPCPKGWRVPTSVEWVAIGGDSKTVYTWSASNLNLSIPGKENGTSLVLPAAGNRFHMTGASYLQGTTGLYWSSSMFSAGIYANNMSFNSEGRLSLSSTARASGISVRCVQE